MDIGSVLGIFLALALVVGSIMVGGSPLSAFYDLPSVLVVFGGALAATMMCVPVKRLLSFPAIAKKVFFNEADNMPEIIRQLVSLAETARRDGLLALESRLNDVRSPFLRLGIQMAVDGTRPEAIEEILRSEIAGLATRHKDGRNVLDQMGKFAPAFGMIGTLIGLVIMLGNMSDPSSIGSGMAVALITTFYGAVASNAIFIPCSEKLGYLNKVELNMLELIVRGVLAIQSGDNPRVVEQKLNTFLPPSQRPYDDLAA